MGFVNLIAGTTRKLKWILHYAVLGRTLVCNQRRNINRLETRPVRAILLYMLCSWKWITADRSKPQKSSIDDRKTIEKCPISSPSKVNLPCACTTIFADNQRWKYRKTEYWMRKFRKLQQKWWIHSQVIWIKFANIIKYAGLWSPFLL